MEQSGCQAVLITASGIAVKSQVNIELDTKHNNNPSKIAAHSDKVFVVNNLKQNFKFSPIRHVVIENKSKSKKEDLLVCESFHEKGDQVRVTHTLYISDEQGIACIYITVAVPCLIVKFCAQVLLPLGLSSNILGNNESKRTEISTLNTQYLRSNNDDNNQNDSVLSRSKRHRRPENKGDDITKPNSSSCILSDINTEITLKDVDISDNDEYSISTRSSSLSIASHSSSESNSDNEDDANDSGHGSEFSDMSELTNLNCDESDFF